MVSDAQETTMLYVPSSPDDVNHILQMADVKPTDTVYDLGCGDGRIVIAAVRDFDAEKGVGIEIREDLVNKAREAVSEHGLGGRVEIIHGDILTVDLSDADVVILFLSPNANLLVQPKLERELKNGARVVSRGFKLFGWTPEREEDICGGVHRRVYLYRIKNKPDPMK